MSIFSRVPVKKTGMMKKRYRPQNTLSFNFGGLYPVFCKNVMPGDTWKMNLGTFIRTVPLISPVMHRNDLKIDAFFVPYRLIWKSAEEWFACNEAVKRPQFYLGNNNEGLYSSVFEPGSLVDYLGFGTPTAEDLQELEIDYEDRKIDAMPIRAYNMIYDYYFRNKAIEDPITANKPDFYGDDDTILRLLDPDTYRFQILYRSWRRDIFTSALPDPQNGPEVVIPQADMDIEADGHLTLDDTSNDTSFKTGQVYGYDTDPASTTYGQALKSVKENFVKATEKHYDYKSGLKVTDSEIPTMRKLRAANLMEEFEEAMARIGYSSGTLNTGKFKEWLRGIWNVRSSDSRLDIPEWLGGYRGPITISEIPQTSGSTENSPQGNLAGKGVSAGGQRIFGKRYFEEPGIMMVIMSVVPKTAYCQGDPREWLYESGFEYPNPYFEGLGEQDVKTRELNCLAEIMANTGWEVPKTFGYNVRNYEMKSFPDEIHGLMRTELAYWHEGRLFRWDNPPGLNKDFLKVKPDDVSRIFPSTEDSDKLIGELFFDIVIKRRLNPYGLPHFSNF